MRPERFTVQTKSGKTVNLDVESVDSSSIHYFDFQIDEKEDGYDYRYVKKSISLSDIVHVYPEFDEDLMLLIKSHAK